MAHKQHAAHAPVLSITPEVSAAPAAQPAAALAATAVHMVAAPAAAAACRVAQPGRAADAPWLYATAHPAGLAAAAADLVPG